MRYLPLVWAALTRRPVRTILIFAAAIIGFTLFGLMTGVNAGFRHMAEQARLDRLYVSSRYGGSLTLAQEQEIAGLPGVVHIGHFDSLAGYVQQPDNRAAVLMASPGMQAVFPELALGEAGWRQLDLVQDGIFLSRAEAARFHVKTGDRFSLLTTKPTRRDGSRLWSFEVLGLVDDIAFFPAGFAVGNYLTLDESRPLAERSRAGQIWLRVIDSTRAEAVARAIEQRFANAPNPVRVDTEKSFFENLGGPDSAVARITEGIAAIGLAMIIFLTGNAMAQSVRERLHEFAVLKTIGFTNRGIVALLFAEAALPCLLGGLLGLCAAAGLALVLPRFLPPNGQFPMPSLSLSFLALGLGAALLAAFVSVALPALRLMRLDIATVLARQMIMLRQIIAVTGLSFRGLKARAKASLTVVASLAFVVAALLFFLCAAEGLRQGFVTSGDARNAIVTSLGSQSERQSALSRTAVATIRDAAGIARGPLADAETAVMVHLQKRNGDDGYTMLRGLGPAGLALRPELKVIAGRMFQPGRRELMVGDMARVKFAGADVGAAINLPDGSWPVVGVFSAGGMVSGDLLGNADVVMPALRRTTYNSVLVRLATPDSFSVFRAALSGNPALEVTVERDSDYWQRQFSDISNPVIVALVLGTLTGLGALAGLLQTMYSAVAARENEIAILRALGFGGAAVAASVVLEAMLLAALGASLGAAIIGHFWSGFAYNGAWGVFRIQFTPMLYGIGLGWALAIALIGALPPAMAAARITVTEGLRAT